MSDQQGYRKDLDPYLRDGRPLRVEAVVLDFDGTLTKPGAIDFAALYEAVGCPPDMGLLEFLDCIADPAERRSKEGILSAAELEGAARSEVNEGASELVAFLRERGVPLAIISRNSRAGIRRAIAKLPQIDLGDFAVVVTRDAPFSPKPFPDGVEFIARQLGVEIDRLLLIGDHLFDIEAGRRAGAPTMFLRNDPLEALPLPDAAPDFVVSTLTEALEIIRYGLPLPVGKLPEDVLECGLACIDLEGSDVLIGAGIGEDAAAVDISKSEVLVLASDPITLALDSMARYAVVANANDVATSGATPRWLLSTMLFPAGSTASEVLALMRDMREACAACGVALCGGHTEITDAVSRPLVVGAVAGTASKRELVDKKTMRQGDRILLTKGVAVEGTGLIAREFRSRLVEAGFTDAEIAEAAAFLDRMSIVEEARIASACGRVTALHDVTEGGLAMAVRELGAAGGRRLRLQLERIPIYRQTERICSVLGLDPLGLIGSGSLLITCPPEEACRVSKAIAAAGILVSDIGEVLGEGVGVEVFKNGVSVEWPYFARDEVSRLSS